MTKYNRLKSFMDERARRLWAGSEAISYGWGGVRLVSKATGLSRNTVKAGLREIQSDIGAGERQRVRRPGGGRKRLTHSYPKLMADLEVLVDPATRGDPMSPLRWTCKSLRRLSAELRVQGYEVSAPSVGELLKAMDYSLQANRKLREGGSHADRNAQFEYIAARTKEFLGREQPVISIDAKKKELVGQYKNGGREWEPEGSPEAVAVHDFADPELGKVTPYGIYDLAHNSGWVSVGIDHDTAEFAVESVRRWWQQMGSKTYPEATELLITADGGGSNGYRVRWWKVQLQGLADDLGLEIAVCHFPPGTSKWNKIEHRMFCHITQNWRGRPLISREVIVSLISNTTTSKGLRIEACLDSNHYATGIQVTDEQMAELRIKPADFHGEWNYTISPRTQKEQEK
jgi:hypothetical protein